MRFVILTVMATFAFFIYKMIAPLDSNANAGDMIILDDFVGNIESKCQLSEEFQAFRSNLIAKYSFDRPDRHPRHIIRIPAYIKPSVGRVSAVDHKSYTEIKVPVLGFYRGLATNYIIITVGHSNGIASAALVFASSAESVKLRLGDSIAATKKYFETDPEGKEMMTTVDLEVRPEGAALICDQSN